MRSTPGPGGEAARPLTEGELWTREQLEALLAGSFRPSAVGRFLLDSQRRANRIRRGRPELGGRARAWIGAGALAWIALAAAGVQPYRRRARGGLAWWALTGAMLDWHLGMVETEDGRPRQLSCADAATLLRVWLVPVAADAPTPAICAVAATSDLLDGALARLAEPTRIGRDLEGLADTCFAVAALRGALARGWVSRWAAAGETARLLAGLAYALYVYFGQAGVPSRTLTRAARMTTPIRAAGLIAAGTRRRGLANALIIGGSAGSVAAVAAALGGHRQPGPGRGAGRALPRAG